MEFVLSDCIAATTSDGTVYEFALNEALYEAGDLEYKIKVNYTLTEEKISELGNKYSGNLYKEFDYMVMGG